MRTWCALAVGWLLGALAWAQTGVGVSPPRVVLPAEPGQRLEGEVVVDHPGKTGPMQVEAMLSDVLVAPDGEPFYLEPGSHPRSAAGWIRYEPVAFALEPKQARTVRYSIEVPADAETGTYWAVLFFDSGPLEPEEARGVGVHMRVRVGHVIYVNVGKVTREGRIEGMRFRPAEGRKPPRVQVKFRNTGNGLLRLNGYVELRDGEGRVAAKGVVHNAASLPGMSYAIDAVLDHVPPTGRYVALARLDYGEAEVIVAEAEVEVP